MTLTIDLQPDIERGLLARAQAKGVSLADFAQEVLTREALPLEQKQVTGTGRDLIDACAKMRGILSDEEIDTLFARSQSHSRPVDFE